MFYRKNIYGWEQVLRTVSGLALALYALLAGLPMAWQYGLAACGVILAVTGAVGFCPMCALAGRRIKAAAPLAE